MYKKKVIAMLVTVLMVFSILPMAVFAEETSTDSWDGTADTSWYQGGVTEFHLTTAEQLAGLAQIVNETGDVFQGVTIYLDTDVDLSGYEWVSIGTGNNIANYFGGTFDGQGHVIKNLTSTNSGNGSYGFFGVISQNGSVKNLGIVDANIQTPNDANSLEMGILADWVNSGTVINCYSTGTIVSAHQSGGFQLIGGLIGQCTAGTQVIGCYSSADVKSLNIGDSVSDTVGGLIGQWENATEDAIITDCYFDGSILCEYTDSGVGGILGANFDFGGMPGVTIRNCFVSTTDITCAEPGNITWIAAVVDSEITNCFWPVSPDTENPYAAVVKLVLDDSGTTASADPNFDESVCGEAVETFTSEEILASLQQNAAGGVTWIAGINGPTFVWDERHILADYTAVNEAVAQANALNKDLYQNFEIVDQALQSVSYTLDSTRQAEVDAMAQSILNAISGLTYKDADYTKVDQAIERANALNRDEYKDFSGVDAAINAVNRDKDITQQAEVDAMAQAIEDAIAGLQLKETTAGTSYQIIEGANSTWNKGNTNGLTVTSNGDFAKFTAVKVDGAEIAAENYTAVSGSTIVTLNASYLETLAEGTHTLTLVYTDGEVSTQFTVGPQTAGVIENTNATASPQTGDSSNTVMWIVVAAAAAGAMAGTVLFARKKKAE